MRGLAAKAATQQQLLARGLAWAFGESQEDVTRELLQTATTAELLRRVAAAVAASVREAASLTTLTSDDGTADTSASPRPHSMDAAAMAQLIIPSALPRPADAEQSVVPRPPPPLQHTPRADGLAAIADPVALVDAHRSLPAGSATLPDRLLCGCPRGACYIEALADVLYNYTPPFTEPPPRRMDPQPIPLNERDAATATRLVRELADSGVVEALPDEQAANPELAHFASSVFVVWRTPARVAPGEEAAVESGDVSVIRRMAHDRAELAFDTARQCAEARPSASPRDWLEAATATYSDPDKAKPRLVLDLRDLNEYIASLPFTMPSGWDAVRRWQQHAWWAIVDITGGFHHVRLAPDARKYFVFRHAGVWYRYTRLVFGLASAPATFCALSAELTLQLRRRGVDVAVTYIDDFVLTAPTEEAGRAALATLRNLFADLNITIREDKLQTGKSITALGLRLHSADPAAAPQPAESTLARAAGIPTAGDPSLDYVSVPGVKLLQALTDAALLQRLLRAAGPFARVPTQFLERLAGRLSWIAATTFAAHTTLRPLWALLRRDHAAGGRGCHRSVTDVAPGSEDLDAMLTFWLSDPLVTGHRIIRSPAHLIASGNSAAIFTDAGVVGFGGYCVPGLLHTAARVPASAVWGAWRKSDALASSLVRELTATLATLIHFGPGLRGKLVLIRTDNAGSAAIINSGRADRDSAQRRTLALRRAAWAFGFEYIAAWTPRELLQLPDDLSRQPSLSAARDAVSTRCRERVAAPIMVSPVPPFVVTEHGDGRIRVDPGDWPDTAAHWRDPFPSRNTLFIDA